MLARGESARLTHFVSDDLRYQTDPIYTINQRTVVSTITHLRFLEQVDHFWCKGGRPRTTSL